VITCFQGVVGHRVAIVDDQGCFVCRHGVVIVAVMGRKEQWPGACFEYTGSERIEIDVLQW